MKRICIFISLAIMLAACREKYIPESVASGKGVLVAEGFIAIGSQVATRITLSRTTDLAVGAINYETKAKLNIQAENGTSYPLTEASPGMYNSAQLSLAPGARYRLQIVTAAGKEYLSDYSMGLTTPQIDSITYARMPDGGLMLYSNSRISSGQTRYYQWKTEETWKFRSQYLSYLKFRTNPSTGGITGIQYYNSNTGEMDTTIFTCWRSENSSRLLLDNLERFSTDVIRQPLVYIAPNSNKLTIMYSLNIVQYGLSKEAYGFLETMKKNSEQLGTTFDPQPSYLQGNIHATNNPSELVIGFVGALQESSKRIFVKPSDIGGWNYTSNCVELTIANDPTMLGGYMFFYPIRFPSPSRTDSVVVARDTCVNCLTRGTNVKPSFWP